MKIGPLERFKAWRKRKRDYREQMTTWVELFDDPYQRPNFLITGEDMLKRLKVDTLHRFIGYASNDAERSAVQGELTRRQNLPALRVAWSAFAVSVLALAVSIIVPLVH